MSDYTPKHEDHEDPEIQEDVNDAISEWRIERAQLQDDFKNMEKKLKKLKATMNRKEVQIKEHDDELVSRLMELGLSMNTIQLEMASA